MILILRIQDCFSTASAKQAKDPGSCFRTPYSSRTGFARSRQSRLFESVHSDDLRKTTLFADIRIAVAILVGLNSTPVHRLNDLPTAIPEIIYKRFRSMNFLMASTRSFAAYRLALTTARPEVIPYL